MPWPFFLPNALPGDKLKKNGVTGKLILTVGGKLTKDPFCCCDPYTPTICDDCPTCEPGVTWSGTATDSGGLAEIMGDGGPWGLAMDRVGTPITAICDPPFSDFAVGGVCLVEFDHCGVHLRAEISGGAQCLKGEWSGYLQVVVEQQIAGPIEWCGIAYGFIDDLPVTLVGGCDQECVDFIVSGGLAVMYSDEDPALHEEGCGMEPGELISCYNQGGVFAIADLTISLNQDDCPPP